VTDPAVVALLSRLVDDVAALRALSETRKAPPPPAQDEPEGLWDATQVAAFLKCSKSWVYDAEAAGRLPSLHIGGMLRFDPRAIRDLAHGTIATGAKVMRLTK
jgi:predicted DNA-binding transcriptional regulator AlpA